MMSVSPPDDSELETVVLNTPEATGSMEEAKIDAQEHRRIVGWELDIGGVSLGEQVAGTVKAYVGTDPNIGAGDVSDLGGKYYSEYEFVFDGTNGLAKQAPLVDHAGDHTGDHSWDWNEDVTLTLEISESGGSNGCIGHLTLYYREV